MIGFSEYTNLTNCHVIPFERTAENSQGLFGQEHARQVSLNLAPSDGLEAPGEGEHDMLDFCFVAVANADIMKLSTKGYKPLSLAVVTAALEECEAGDVTIIQHPPPARVLQKDSHGYQSSWASSDNLQSKHKGRLVGSTCPQF